MWGRGLEERIRGRMFWGNLVGWTGGSLRSWRGVLGGEKDGDWFWGVGFEVKVCRAQNEGMH